MGSKGPQALLSARVTESTSGPSLLSKIISYLVEAISEGYREASCLSQACLILPKIYVSAHVASHQARPGRALHKFPQDLQGKLGGGKDII